MDELEWREAVEATRKGDKKAFETLYRETERSVYFTCLKLLANEDTAKDIMQDTFMTALDKLENLDDGAKFPKWINRIAVNKCKDKFKKRTDDSLDEQLEQGSDFKDDESFIPEEYVTDKAKRKIIMDIINDVLSDVQRQVIIMYYYDEMSLEEIAEAMDCPIKTVSSRLCTAREKIREAVLAYEKKHHDKLHALVPIPILTQILHHEAASISVPDISPILLGSHFFNTAAISSASTTSTVVAGGSKMVGFLTGKAVAMIAAGVIAVGGITTALVLSGKGSNDNVSSSSSAVSSAAAADTSSSVIVTEKNVSSTQDSKTESKTETSSSEAKAANEWDIQELSAMIESIKGKPIAEAKQILADNLGTPVDKWEVTTEDRTEGKVTFYSCDIPDGIKVHNVGFDYIYFVEHTGTGVVCADNKGGASVTMRKRHKGDLSYQAEKSANYLNEQFKKDGLEGDKNRRNTWHTNSGSVCVGHFNYSSKYYAEITLQFFCK